MVEIFLIAVSLALDAFAVSVSSGISVPGFGPRQAVKMGLWFGTFQFLMPLLGWLLGSRFQGLITSVDHWIAFVLLCAIGGNMVRESRTCGACGEMDASFAPKVMLPLAVATSIDALAVGVTFAFLRVDILPAVCFIGAVTFVFSFAGVKMGSVFGARYQSKAELFGGGVLIGMGIKILLEHLGVLG